MRLLGAEGLTSTPGISLSGGRTADKISLSEGIDVMAGLC